jgi:hypothetical protein
MADLFDLLPGHRFESCFEVNKDFASNSSLKRSDLSSGALSAPRIGSRSKAT